MSIKPLLSLPSCLLRRDRLAILIYHRILPRPDPFLPNTVNQNDFKAQMSMLASYFNVLSLGDALDALSNDALPPRAACITFDDGYADNEQLALPILTDLGLQATFFIATDFIDRGAMWLDIIMESVRAFAGDKMDLSAIGLATYPSETAQQKHRLLLEILPKFRYMPMAERNEKAAWIQQRYADDLNHHPMMTSAQLKHLAEAGMTIGAHTRGHPNLALTPDSEAEREIVESKQKLESLIGAPVDYFAYPFGKEGKDFLCSQSALVAKLGFKAAVTTDPGVATAATDRYRLPRFTPWDKTRFKFALRLALNYRNAV